MGLEGTRAGEGHDQPPAASSAAPMPPPPLENAARPPRPGPERPPGGDDGGDEGRQFDRGGRYADRGVIDGPPPPGASPSRGAAAAESPSRPSAKRRRRIYGSYVRGDECDHARDCDGLNNPETEVATSAPEAAATVGGGSSAGTNGDAGGSGGQAESAPPPARGDSERGGALRPAEAEADADASGATKISDPPSADAATAPDGGAVAEAETDAVESDVDEDALHVAMGNGATEVALGLILGGASADRPNAKGVTPLILASQKGDLRVVSALLQRGVATNAATMTGSTALIQACHFGRLAVVEALLSAGATVEQSNYKNTTALMRASQEGWMGVVRALLRRGAAVDRRNDERMSALMLASQRGHEDIVRELLDAGADVDAKTAQGSTSLMLAFKREHFEAAKILVASGAELMSKDAKGRTALEAARKASRRGSISARIRFADILSDTAQLSLMKQKSMRERNHVIVNLWTLLQRERATIRLGIDAGRNGAAATRADAVSVHEIAAAAADPSDGSTADRFDRLPPSRRALIRAMALPAPLVEAVARFLPEPLLWAERIALLRSRGGAHPDSAVGGALDLIDEMLEEGGLLDAFDASGVPPPADFDTWSAGCQHGHGLRGGVNYLQILDRNFAPPLWRTLLSPPYNMPESLLYRLKDESDVQSLVRRQTGGVHFDNSVAVALVTLAHTTMLWCISRHTY